MAEIKKSLKGIWLKSMEAISNTASNIASNTKYKVDEMTILNRRKEILSDFGAKSYELWQKGEVFPEPLDALMKELSELDESLNAIRTEKLAGVKTNEETQPPAEEADVAEATKEAAEDVAEAAEDVVEALGDAAKANHVSEKLDAAVGTVGSTLKKLGSKIEGGIEALTKAMKPKTEEAVAVQTPAEEPAPVIDVKEETVKAAEPVVEMEADLPEEPKAPVIEIETKPEE